MSGSDIHLSLVSHTNVGKTTLARTLLQREVGEVRDAPHVTEFADHHELMISPEGDRLLLWDTPGFGDSVRLLKRLRTGGNALTDAVGWFLSEVWDRWRDRAFWASQQALRHVRESSDLVLYLVNAGEPEAGYIAPEMDLLAWMERPVLVLLNQLGAPRSAAEEAAETALWRDKLARWPQVRAVLPLDAFARCWVHEDTLLTSAQAALAPALQPAMARLVAAWRAQREQAFQRAVRALAESVVRLAATRELVDEAPGWGERFKRLAGRLRNGDSADTPQAAAQQRLAATVQAEVRAGTATLLALHGLHAGAPEDPRGAVAEILGRVATQFEPHQRVPEGRAAMLGGALTGALAGLKADIVTGGLTLGGGMLAGGILGALGAAGVARGLNIVRGTERSWVTLGEPALAAATEAAVLRYLAVAHFGRGRGDWREGEAPAHWPAAVSAALAPRQVRIAALLAPLRTAREGAAADSDRDTAISALMAELDPALRQILAALYPGAQ